MRPLGAPGSMVALSWQEHHAQLDELLADLHARAATAAQGGLATKMRRCPEASPVKAPSPRLSPAHRSPWRVPNLRSIEQSTELTSPGPGDFWPSSRTPASSSSPGRGRYSDWDAQASSARGRREIPSLDFPRLVASLASRPASLHTPRSLGESPVPPRPSMPPPPSRNIIQEPATPPRMTTRRPRGLSKDELAWALAGTFDKELVQTAVDISETLSTLEDRLSRGRPSLPPPTPLSESPRAWPGDQPSWKESSTSCSQPPLAACPIQPVVEPMIPAMAAASLWFPAPFQPGQPCPFRFVAPVVAGPPPSAGCFHQHGLQASPQRASPPSRPVEVASRRTPVLGPGVLEARRVEPLSRSPSPSRGPHEQSPRRAGLSRALLMSVLQRRLAQEGSRGLRAVWRAWQREVALAVRLRATGRRVASRLLLRRNQVLAAATLRSWKIWALAGNRMFHSGQEQIRQQTMEVQGPVGQRLLHWWLVHAMDLALQAVIFAWAALVAEGRSLDRDKCLELERLVEWRASQRNLAVLRAAASTPEGFRSLR